MTRRISRAACLSLGVMGAALLPGAGSHAATPVPPFACEPSYNICLGQTLAEVETRLGSVPEAKERELHAEAKGTSISFMADFKAGERGSSSFAAMVRAQRPHRQADLDQPRHRRPGGQADRICGRSRQNLWQTRRHAGARPERGHDQHLGRHHRPDHRRAGRRQSRCADAAGLLRWTRGRPSPPTMRPTISAPAPSASYSKTGP